MVVLNGLNDLEVAAEGDYPAAIPLAGLASSQACQNCHGASGEAGRFDPENRGGHYSAPMSAEACVVCHRPDDPSTPDVDEEPSYMQFFRVVHGIHNSHEMPAGEFVTDRGNSYNITYPTYMTNCSVCHSDETIVPATGGTALAAANAMPVSGRGCLSCHGSMDSWTFPESLSFHDLIADPLTHDCQTACHEPGGLGQAKIAVAAFHNGVTTERGGIIWDGVDTSVAEGALFDWQINGVERVVVDGVDSLAIDWQASYDGIPVDPCNETLGPGAPTFHAAVDADGEFTGNLSMLRNYAQGDDFILGRSTSAPGQALSVNVTVDNTTCTSLVATTIIPADDVTADRGIIALQGKPRTVSPDPAGPAEGQRVRAKTPTYEFMVADGSAPVALRRDIVVADQCLKCHVGSLYQHGGNRVDNPGMCILCHNSASNEKNVRVGMGVDESEAYDGRAGQTFELKTMLHRIHSAGAAVDSPPYVVYRNRGIYAFAPDVSMVPNWNDGGTAGCTDAEIARGERDAFGSDPTSSNSCQPHNFHAPTYPRALNACSACHVPGLAVQPDQTQAMATTVDAGGTVWEDQLDDVLQGAATTACITCHTTAPAKGHAYQNSWQPQEFEEGRQTIIDAVN